MALTTDIMDGDGLTKGHKGDAVLAVHSIMGGISMLVQYISSKAKCFSYKGNICIVKGLKGQPGDHTHLSVIKEQLYR